MESVSEVLGENWLDGPLELLGDWVFAKACKACSAIVPDMVLGDIPKLGFAVFPCSQAFPSMMLLLALFVLGT